MVKKPEKHLSRLKSGAPAGHRPPITERRSLAVDDSEKASGRCEKRDFISNHDEFIINGTAVQR